MKKIVKFGAALLATLFLSSSVNASDQIGIGAGVSSDQAIIRADVDIDNNMRIEPYFGYIYSNPDNYSSTTSIEAGIALHIKKGISGKLKGYYGGFAGIDYYDSISSTTNFIVGPVGGVEYFFDPQFSFGGEIRLKFGFGDDTTLQTNSIALIRYYF